MTINKINISVPSTLNQLSEGVYSLSETCLEIGQVEIEFLKLAATQALLRRARICLHNDPKETVQNMIIAICDDSKLLPHKHPRRIEYFLHIEGDIDLVVFSEDGIEKKRVKLGSKYLGYSLATKVWPGEFHTFVSHSPVSVILETANGPFCAQETEYAIFD